MADTESRGRFSVSLQSLARQQTLNPPSGAVVTKQTLPLPVEGKKRKVPPPHAPDKDSAWVASNITSSYSQDRPLAKLPANAPLADQHKVVDRLTANQEEDHHRIEHLKELLRMADEREKKLNEELVAAKKNAGYRFAAYRLADLVGLMDAERSALMNYVESLKGAIKGVFEKYIAVRCVCCLDEYSNVVLHEAGNVKHMACETCFFSLMKTARKEGKNTINCPHCRHELSVVPIHIKASQECMLETHIPKAPRRRLMPHSSRHKPWSQLLFQAGVKVESPREEYVKFDLSDDLLRFISGGSDDKVQEIRALLLGAEDEAPLDAMINDIENEEDDSSD